jgi:hypothetical protein
MFYKLALLALFSTAAAATESCRGASTDFEICLQRSKDYELECAADNNQCFCDAYKRYENCYQVSV